MTAVAIPSTVPAAVAASVEKLAVFLETGGAEVPDGLFAADVFADVSLPHWRLQAAGASAVTEVRRTNHPQRGVVRVEKVLGDETGYSMKLEERWHDGAQEWYCREAFLCELDASGAIADFSVYCTGDWDERLQREHGQAVTLLRP
jgi:hypothetical protein